LANDSSWLAVSSTGGTLNPGASSTVTVSLNSNANNFLITHASGNVTFDNLTTFTTQNRQFDLYVGNGGFETGGLDYWTYVGDPSLTFAIADDDEVTAGQPAETGQPDALFVHSGIYGGCLAQGPDNGTLSQTVPTSAGQRLLVSFWLTSVFSNPPGDTTPNGFTAKWNGSTLFTGTNLATFGWTNMQYLIFSSGTSGTVEFDFNNTPGAFGLDDIVVEPVPGPTIQSVAMSHGNVMLTWGSFSNLTYQVQSATSLIHPNWTNIASPITATGNFTSASEPAGTAPQRFYRIMLLPSP
jgi:hypothetical protein